MPKISVIVPVYNGEKYLEKCLDSLIGQTLRDIEIIAVDNGSVDGSANILATYAEKDERVKVLTLNPNQGPAGARNAALDIAAGEYIAFCDCDDTVPEEAYRLFYKSAIEANADIVVADYIEDIDGRIVEHRVCNPQKSAYVICEMGALWNKIYRREFLNSKGLRIPDYIGDEDLLFLAKVLACEPSYTMSFHRAYRYNRHAENGDALSKTYTVQMIDDNLHARLAYDRIVSRLKYESADSRAFYSFRFVFRKWCRMKDRADKETCFRLLQNFVDQSDWKNTAERFKRITGMKPDEFAFADYDEFLCRYHAYAIDVLGDVEEKRTKKYAESAGPEEQVETMFRQGNLGFRYIWRYGKEWLAYKIKR